MGTFLGHLVPGLALAFLGLWHTVNTICVYYLKGSTKFTLRFWYPLTHNLKHLELILILSFSIFSILFQIFDLQHFHFFFELDNIEHSTIFLQLIIFTVFSLVTDLINLSEKMLQVSGILVTSIFAQELFLLHYHSTDHAGLEGHYHWLMQLIVCVSLLAALCGTVFPASFPTSLILSMSVVFQGCWFVNMGFVLWVPDFIPRGCMAQQHVGAPSNGVVHGAVVCGTHESGLRAKAFANLQFCWILSAILIFMVSVCVCVGRRCGTRKQSLEYEQLDSPGANVGFKQIQL